MDTLEDILSEQTRLEGEVTSLEAEIKAKGGSPPEQPKLKGEVTFEQIKALNPALAEHVTQLRASLASLQATPPVDPKTPLQDAPQQGAAPDRYQILCVAAKTPTALTGVQEIAAQLARKEISIDEAVTRARAILIKNP